MFGIIKIGKISPRFELESVIEDKTKKIDSQELLGQWIVLGFYPGDFEEISESEIQSFEKHSHDFKAINCKLMLCSTDSIFTHKAWIKKLGKLSFPLLSDKHHSVAIDYNVFDDDNAQAIRSTFIIDPEGRLRWSEVSDNLVPREVRKILDILKKIQLANP